MSKKKVMVIFGTRPEAVKLAPVIDSLIKINNLQTIVLCTAQHRQILDQVVDVFNININFDLNIMTSFQTIDEITTACLQGVGRILEMEKPDFVVVQGDTTTVFASTLASYYQRIPVGHVEAGLRTSDLFSPYPEEANRRLTSVLTNLHFAPTERAAANLKREGVDAEKIYVTGNTVIDALFSVSERPFDASKCFPRDISNFLDGVDRLILVTAHRRESFGAPFLEICKALQDIIRAHSGIGIIYPVHPNPNVREIVHEILDNEPRVLLVEPLDYITFIRLMQRSYILLTDSGGVQEEAPSLGKPVLIMREKTERQEGVEAGVARLIGTNRNKIFEEVSILLRSKTEYNKMLKGFNPFGDGKAAEKIAKIINNYLTQV